MIRKLLLIGIIFLFIHCASSDYPTIGGVVTGLDGTLVLQNNGGDNLTIKQSGRFTFTDPVLLSFPYKVTVKKQPTGQTCTVNDGSGNADLPVTNIIVVCADDVADTPDGPTTINQSVSNLALSVTGLTLDGNASGTPRSVTITNAGSVATKTIDVFPLSALPAGSSFITTCTTLAPGASCSISIIPGATPSAAVGDNSPSTISFAIEAENTNTLGLNVYILNYGSFYQGGYVFSMDESTPATQSIGGKVLTQIDQSTSILWSSNGIGSATSDVSYDKIPGIDETSTSSVGSPTFASFSSYFSSAYVNILGLTSGAFNLCNGISDGACNSANIRAFYNFYQTNFDSAGVPPFTAVSGATNLSFYAAGLCAATIDGYSDWYLPAICETGYDRTSVGSGCGTQMAPTFQNVQSNLIETAGIAGFGLLYWSSTEFSAATPEINVWYQALGIGGITQQGGADKNNTGGIGVRCARAFTS